MAASSQPSSSSSSSSCVPTRGSTYDIFLSFRGEDTRNNFVDHLFAALVQKGIRTFKDDQMLGGGKPISQSLLKAIKKSKFAVVVFSKNYANSSWCLDELSEIMECHVQMGLKVLPVFYHVDPTDVRKQKGILATDFEQQEGKLMEEMDKVNKWKKALTAAANISGYHISTVSGGEYATINKIVHEILVCMQPRDREENLIGIEFHMEKLNSLLSIEATDMVRIVGIHGMGGIGKTTLARVLFRRIAYKFEGSSFVSNVRENSSSNKDICALQEKILGDILEAHHGFTIQDPQYGADMIRESFSNKKVLLVIDDVDDVKQLEFLATTHWFGPGSRIIITTRDKHVLSAAKIVNYTPTLLRMDQAFELFCRHAFKANSPPDELRKLSYRAIRCTGGLPLALKVLGSFFHGREADVWESALDRLSETPNKEVFRTLKLSFYGLEESEKKIFLDIACFFKGQKVDDVTRILDGFGFHPVIGIRILIEKSLITISENMLGMHDLIQEMGWQIVHEIAPNSRLWKEKEILDLIKKSMNFELIEAIVLSRKMTYVDLNLVVDDFKKMKNLRLLVINQEFTIHKPAILPDELLWLCWDYYPFSSLQVSNMCKLVGLKIFDGKIEHLWTGQKIMLNLKFIHLVEMRCLTRFPDVSRVPNIERLTLSCCDNLVEVDESLGFLKRLVYLDMSYCWNLKCLPSRIEMESLETLILHCCRSLERLPEFSFSMVNLSHIDCSDCSELQELPTSIRNVSNLSILNLRGCRRLNDIPESISDLKSIKIISLHGCSELQKPHLGLVESFKFYYLTNLCSLRKLDLSYIQIGHQYFPRNLYELSSLEELALCVNEELKQLPSSITQISHLKCLDLTYCNKIQSINGLPSGIQVLIARNCKSLEVIEDLSEEYKCLRKIHLSNCKKLSKDKQNERYLDKILEQSFLKKWSARDGCLSIFTPGSKIPRWFQEQQNGNEIALKLPFKWQTEIMGFAICCIMKSVAGVLPYMIFRLENGGMLGRVTKVDHINESETAAVDDENENVWIGYVPLSVFENMLHIDDDDYSEGEDWSHVIEGNLIIELKDAREIVRCGAKIVYKEVESTQQIIKPSISSSYYWTWELRHDPASRITNVYG